MSGSVEIEKRKCNIFFSRKPMKSRQLCPKYFKLTMYNVNSYVCKKNVLHLKALIVLPEVLDIRSQKMCCCHTYEHGSSCSDLRPVALEELDD